MSTDREVRRKGYPRVVPGGLRGDAVTADGERGTLLTLEPLVEAVRDGVEAAGWELSGMQKTTSHHFEGRWEGDSTRSAYLFFHRSGADDDVSVDVYLDETTAGLKGNLALVLDGPDLGELGDPGAALETLGRAAAGALPEGYRTPLTLRFRLPDGGADASGATSEIRFKLLVPRAAMDAGASAVSALGTTAVQAFERLLGHPGVREYRSGS